MVMSEASLNYRKYEGLRHMKKIIIGEHFACERVGQEVGPRHGETIRCPFQTPAVRRLRCGENLFTVPPHR